MTIEIKVTKAHIEFLGNHLLVELDVIKRMKRAGVPIAGNSFFYGVDHGRLEITADNEHYIYRWHPDPKHKAPTKVPYDPLNDDEDEEL